MDIIEEVIVRGYREYLLYITFCILVMAGCTTNEQKAQHLFNEGDYEQIQQRFSDLPIAVEARKIIVEKLMSEGKYEEIINRFPHTKYSRNAECWIRDLTAERLYQEGKFDSLLLDEFQHSPAQKAYLELPEVKERTEQEEKKRRAQVVERILSNRREFLNNPEYFFASGKILAGMKKYEVSGVVGRADDVNTTVVAGGTLITEQWVYERDNYEMIYLYFKNAVLESWQY